MPAQAARPAADEVRALGSAVRREILRLAAQAAPTNNELAEALGLDPATALYHVRRLVDAGLLEALPVRRGARGSREKPYRATGVPWWFDEAASDERRVLHLSDEQLDGLAARLRAVIDEYAASDDERTGRPRREVRVAIR